MRDDKNLQTLIFPVMNIIFITAQGNFGCERSRYRSGNLFLATSPRWDTSSMSVISPASLCGHNESCQCHDENKTRNQLQLGKELISTKNPMI